MGASVPTIRQCRYCYVWRPSGEFSGCELGRELLITTAADECCGRFRSGGVLPETWVDLMNITESEEALLLCEVGERC